MEKDAADHVVACIEGTNNMVTEQQQQDLPQEAVQQQQPQQQQLDPSTQALQPSLMGKFFFENFQLFNF